jgi:hypothetical protein
MVSNPWLGVADISLASYIGSIISPDVGDLNNEHFQCPNQYNVDRYRENSFFQQVI